MYKDEVYEKFLDDFCIYIAKEIYIQRQEETKENLKKMKEKEASTHNYNY